VLHGVRDPLHRGQDLRHAHPAVLVGVDVRQRLGGERDALHRQRQRDPELGVELVEVEQVVAVVERDLVDAAGAEELPAMGRHQYTGASRRMRLAMTTRWICAVPSKMSKTLMSRYHFSTSRWRSRPWAPSSCTASAQTFIATLAA